MFPAPSADRHGPNRMGDSRRTAEARQGPRGLGCPTAVGLYAPLKPLAGRGRAGLGPESSSGTGGVSDEALAEAPRRAMTSTTHRHEIGGSGFGTTPELLSEGAGAREGGVTFGSFFASEPRTFETRRRRHRHHPATCSLSLPGSLVGKKDGPLYRPPPLRGSTVAMAPQGPGSCGC